MPDKRQKEKAIWDYTILAIYTMAFIVTFYLFLNKKEYNERTLLVLHGITSILLVVSLFVLKTSKIPTFVYITSTFIIWTTIFWGDKAMRVETLEGYKITYGGLIGKPSNYYEISFTNDKGEDFLYKGEYLEHGRHKHSITWHGKGAWYKRYTVKAKNVYKLLYNGTWNKGKFHGTGTRYWYSRGNITDKYTGSFVNGEMTGKGTYYWYEANVCTKVYKGDFIDGEEVGFGTSYFAEKGDTTRLRPLYTGQWKGGKYHGHGKLYRNDGKAIIYEGEFKDGLQSDPKK